MKALVGLGACVGALARVSLRAVSTVGSALEPASIKVQKVKLEIFYETQCPFSLSLIANGLREVWKEPELRERIDLSLYPSGNTQIVPKPNVSSGYRFWHTEFEEPGQDYVFLCQHGESECLGNLIQACAIERLSEPSAYLPLIFCMSALPQYAVEKSSYECAQHLGLDLEPVRACTKSAEGNKIMHNIATHSNTLTPPRSHVPWVTMNGQHEFIGDSGDILGPLCGLLTGEKPAACATANSASDTAATFAAMAAAMGGSAPPAASNSTPEAKAPNPQPSPSHAPVGAAVTPPVAGAKFCVAPGAESGATPSL